MLSLEARNKSNERLISHLNLQVDYLQQTNQDLDDRIRELEDGKAAAVLESNRLRAEVDGLHDELRNIDRLAQQLEQEKQNAVLTADREIHNAQTELRNSQRIGENTENRLLDCSADRDRLSKEKHELQDNLDAMKLDVERLHGLLEKVQIDKRLLSDKVQAVTAREKSLIIELEQYRANPSKARRKVKSPSKLDNFVRSLEQERDHYREECDQLQSMLQEYKCKARGRSQSPGTRSPLRSSPSKKLPNEKNKSKNRLSEVESERDFYKREYNLLKTITKSKLPLSKPPSSHSPMGCHGKQSYEALARERDELQTMLSKFERHMAEIQANVKVLTKERDKTNLLYEETNDELQRLRRDYVRSPKSPKASVTAQAILRRVENERDSSIADLRRMTTERDSLRERLKIQQEQSINERSRLEQKVEDCESKARSLNEDRIDFQGQNDALKNLNLAQEDDIKALRMKMDDLEEECRSLRSELSDTKLMKSQIQSSLDCVERELSRKSTDLALADDRIASQEKRISDLLRETDNKTEEIVTLRATTTTLDREKDALQVALDERAERVASLDDQLSRREREISDMRSTNCTLESKAERLGDELATSDREVRSLRRQLELSQADLSDCNRAKDAGSRENRRLHDELTSLSRQHQDLNIEMDDATRSRDDLKRQFDDRGLKVNDLETQLTCKEKELLEVLDQYRKVSSERDGAESRYRTSNDEAQSLRAELLAMDGDRKRCIDRISILERELSDYKRAQQSCESQISGLKSTVAELEADSDRMRADRASLQGDLHSARDINSKLDANKEHIARQLSAKTLEYDQLKANCEDLNRELEIVHKHLDAERAGNKNLEELIAGVREKEFQAQLDAQDQKSESQLLRDKLALNESKLQSMAREISSLRDRTSQMDAELEVTKRHLTNERYERERAVQELRRHGLPSPGLSRMSRPLSPGDRSKSRSPGHLSFLDTSR